MGIGVRGGRSARGGTPFLFAPPPPDLIFLVFGFSFFDFHASCSFSFIWLYAWWRFVSNFFVEVVCSIYLGGHGRVVYRPTPQVLVFDLVFTHPPLLGDTILWGATGKGRRYPGLLIIEGCGKGKGGGGWGY